MERNKLFLPFLLLLALLPVAMADLQIDRIRGYVNNERVGGIDEDGGRFAVDRDDTLELIITIENTYQNQTARVRFESKIENIDDGGDLKEDQNWFEIDPDSDKAKTISYFVPTIADYDYYDMELEIEYQIDNGTADEWGSTKSFSKIDFDVLVQRPSDDKESTTLTVEHMSSVILNLTNSVQSVADTAGSCLLYLGQYNNCSSELSTVKEDRGTYRTRSEDLTGRVTTLESDKSEIEREKTVFENRVKNMEDTWMTQQQCHNTTRAAVKDEEDKSATKLNTFIGIAVFGGLGFWYFNKKKKAKATVEDSFYYEK